MQGDSGGPFWQYDMGRAVIAAVFIDANGDSNSPPGQLCEPHSKSYRVGAMRIDWDIDWIKNVTKLN